MPKQESPSTLDLIIPTYYPEPFLAHAVKSLLETAKDANVIVVNNSPHELRWDGEPRVTVIEAGENLGWEGGLALGLKHSKAPFVGFVNDDIFVPPCSEGWWTYWLELFGKDLKIAAIGPSSNLVMGPQNIWVDTPMIFEANFLIGFFVVMRRSALDQAGGVDTELPGGDDLDLSIRLWQIGNRLVVDKTTFVFHHGFVTGNRIHGDHNHPNGWNSREMSERTRRAIVEKHGKGSWDHLFGPLVLSPSGLVSRSR